MAERLTVLQMLPALDSGGVERGTLEVAAALVERGHRALVVSAGGRLEDDLAAVGAEHVTLPVGAKRLSTLLLVSKVRRLLVEEGVDVLHLRSRLPAWVGYLAWRGLEPRKRPRLVTTVHGFYSVNRYSAIMTRGERVIAISESARRYVEDNYPDVDPTRIRVIHRGIDPTVYRHGYQPPQDWLDRWQRDHAPLSQRFVLTLPGRVTRLKGHHDFITIVARLHAQGVPVHGLIAGGEDPRRLAYAEELRQHVADAGLGSCISFIGHRTDLREVMAVSDVVLSLSAQPEAFGRTVAEALALGRPVLGYDHGGVGEQLRLVLPAGRVPVGDVDAAVSTLARWRTEPPAVHLESAFTLENMLRKTLEIYSELVTTG